MRRLAKALGSRHFGIRPVFVARLDERVMSYACNCICVCDDGDVTGAEADSSSDSVPVSANGGN